MKRKGLIILVVLIANAVIAAVFAYQYYQYIYSENVQIEDAKSVLIYIPTGADYEMVKDSLGRFIINEDALDWVSEKKQYIDNVKPGCYKIKNGMTSNTLVNLLRSGNQEPVNITFNNLRKTDQLAGILAEKLEPDSLDFVQFLTDPKVIDSCGFDAYSFPVMFIPDTYQFFWNTSAEEFGQRMKSEYNKFWNDERIAKAENIGLSPVEISSLASIVEQETKQIDEKAIVAGVYMNRIERGMPLQADPTLVFAHGDFSIRRVLNRHKKIDSPYNTYIYKGIPPGPICLPDKSSIDAVLNFEKHDYIFFCAKPDYRGYHNFSKTLRQHEAYAREYRSFLNSERIYR